MSRPDVDALAAEVVLLMKSALAPVLAQQAAQQVQITALEANTVAPEIAPEDIAASVAGLLRKELADLDAATIKTKRRVEKDSTGYTITEEPA